MAIINARVAVAFGLDPTALVKNLGAARIAVKSPCPKDLADAQLRRPAARRRRLHAFARRIAYLRSARAPAS